LGIQKITEFVGAESRGKKPGAAVPLKPQPIKAISSVFFFFSLLYTVSTRSWFVTAICTFLMGLSHELDTG
jgi:hypothetical protein